jgi:hypothetical protein
MDMPLQKTNSDLPVEITLQIIKFSINRIEILNPCFLSNKFVYSMHCSKTSNENLRIFRYEGCRVKSCKLCIQGERKWRYLFACVGNTDCQILVGIREVGKRNKEDRALGCWGLAECAVLLQMLLKDGGHQKMRSGG